MSVTKCIISEIGLTCVGVSDGRKRVVGAGVDLVCWLDSVCGVWGVNVPAWAGVLQWSAGSVCAVHALP